MMAGTAEGCQDLDLEKPEFRSVILATCPPGLLVPRKCTFIGNLLNTSFHVEYFKKNLLSQMIYIKVKCYENNYN